MGHPSDIDVVHEFDSASLYHGSLRNVYILRWEKVSLGVGGQGLAIMPKLLRRVAHLLCSCSL
jgi:hypothetical protein